MWLPVLAALACTLTSPATPAPLTSSAGTVATAAMSLPLDGGPMSQLDGRPMSQRDGGPMSQLDDWISLPPAAEWALAALEPFTPAVVECADDGARPPAPDCSALASRWTADMIGSCAAPRPSYARMAAIRRARALAGGSRLLGGGALRELPPPLFGDPQNPVCPHAVAIVWPAPSSSPLALAPPASPPSPPERRIDRPPRA
jgi:hypothetical protein